VNYDKYVSFLLRVEGPNLMVGHREWPIYCWNW